MRRPITILLTLCLLVAGCGPRHEGPAIVVAGGASEEALLLGQLALTLLGENGYPTEDSTGLSSAGAVRDAVTSGHADLYWAYAGDTWAGALPHQEPVADPYLLFQRVREEDAEAGIVWLGPASVRARLALLVTPALATQAGLETTSDLVSYQRRTNPYLSVCAPEGLQEAASGVRGLERVYGLRFERRVVVSASAEGGYRALEAGECDCALGHTSDHEVRLSGLRVLADDLAFFPPSNLALGVRREPLDAHPELEGLLTRMIALVDEEALAAIQRQVTVHAMDRGAAVRAFLRRGDLLPTWPNLPGSEG